jgi:PAS domain S-box-containing protein
MDEHVAHVLVIENAMADAEAVQRAFASQAHRFRLRIVDSLEAARAYLLHTQPDLVIGDLRLPEGQDLGLLPAEGKPPLVPVVVMTRYGDEQMAVRAMKAGVLDYVVKSEAALADMPHIAERALRQWRHITERRRAEAALAAERNLLRTLIDNIPDCIFAKDTQSRFTLGNLAVARVMGAASPDELLGKTDFDFYPSDLAAQYYADEQAILQSGQPLINHEELVEDQTTGAPEWYLTVKVPLRDSAGQIAGLVGISRDVTARKRAEEVLRENERRFRALIENSWDAVALVGEDGTIRYVSPTITRILGYAVDDYVGRRAFEFVHPDDYQSAQNLFAAMLREPDKSLVVQLRERHKDGSWRWLEGLATNLLAEPGVQAIVANFRDVTERKQAEEALRAGEARYRAIVQDQTELICRTRPDGTLTFVNDAYCRYFNRTAEALLGSRFQPPIYPPDVEVVSRKRLTLSAQTPTVTYWHRVELPGDGIRWQQWTDHVLYDDQGQLVEIQSVGQDITDRKQAEAALKQRNEQLLALNAIATAISHAPDVNRMANDVLDQLIELLRIDGGCLYLYDEVEAGRPLVLVAQRGLLGTAQERLNTIQMDTAPSAVAPPARLVARALNAIGWDEASGHHVGVPIQSKDVVLGVLGVFRHSLDKLSPDERQTLATVGHQVGVAIENMRLVAQAAEVEILRELDRLRSELIANVSHELRTPLGLISLFCTTLLREEVTLNPETQREFLNDIKEEADRLEAIVDNLLDLSRLQAGRLHLDRRPTDLRDLIQRTLDAMQPQLTGHRFVFNFPEGPLVAEVDARRFEQVLLNLGGNAIKYSPAGGDITVTGRQTGPEILLQIQDQGIGIPPQDLTRIFERFYRVSNELMQQIGGAGLGLAVCQGIVEAHGGRIWAESVPGAGSTFYFTLPVAVADPVEGE